MALVQGFPWSAEIGSLIIGLSSVLFSWRNWRGLAPLPGMTKSAGQIIPLKLVAGMIPLGIMFLSFSIVLPLGIWVRSHDHALSFGCRLATAFFGLVCVVCVLAVCYIWARRAPRFLTPPSRRATEQSL